MTENPWKTNDSKIVYQNPWIKVREDSVTQPDGKPGIYGVVETHTATAVVAMTPANEVYLVGQYRYPTKEYSWEVIEGGSKDGETPLQAAKRELIEEAGLEAEEWFQLGPEVHLSNCISDERGVIFLARGLKTVPRNPDCTEILELKTMPFHEVLEEVRKGQIKDAMSIIAILRTEHYLK